MRAPMEKGLASIWTPRRVQHPEGVAGAVADGEDDGVGVDLLAVGQGKAADVAVGVQDDVLDAGREAIFAAQGFDPGADAFHDGDETKGADMGFAGGEDLFRRAGRDKRGEEFAGEVAGVLDAGIQLAVGEGAGAALAELDVGFGGKN